MSRFVVFSVGGFKNNRAYGSSYFVADTAFNYRVVASFDTNRGRTSLRCKQLAEQRCDELNAWNDALAARLIA